MSKALSERLVQQVKMQLDERPMSLRELARRIRVEEKQVYRVLSLLHRSSQIVHFKARARAIGFAGDKTSVWWV